MRNKDSIIETYLGCLEEILLDIQIFSNRYNNVTKKERDAFYSLRDDPTIIIKSTEKGSVVAAWDSEDYLKQGQRSERKVPNQPSVLVNSMTKA